MTVESILLRNEQKIVEHCQRLLAQKDLSDELAGRLRGILAGMKKAVQEVQ